MKKLLLLILLSLYCWGYGQNLSLSQLISLRTMDLDNMETMLNQKGWKFINAEQGENSSGTVSFIYSSTNSLQYGEAFLSRFTFENSEDTIWLQISKQAKYLEYLNAVKSFNPTLTFSGARDNSLVKIYQGATTTFEFATSTTIDKYGQEAPSWFLTIYKNRY
ncbi:hypothetical protein ACK2M7_01730 [Chryseobacterium sp. TY4]